MERMYLIDSLENEMIVLKESILAVDSDQAFALAWHQFGQRTCILTYKFTCMYKCTRYGLCNVRPA